MERDYLGNMDTNEPTSSYAGIERALRNRLRLAQRISMEETGAAAPEIVVAVFEQLCFRYDEVSTPVAH